MTTLSKNLDKISECHLLTHSSAKDYQNSFIADHHLPSPTNTQKSSESFFGLSDSEVIEWFTMSELFTE